MKKSEKEFYREKLADLDLGLEDRLTSKVGLLSGGQRQAANAAHGVLKNAESLAFRRAYRRA